MKPILFTLLLLPLLQGCKDECPDARIREMMGDLYKKQILFPAELELLNKTGVDSAYWTKINTGNRPYYIIHFFMSDCDKCVHELVDIQRFVEKHKSDNDVDYIFITSGPTDIYARDAINQSGFKLPVYYEKNYFSFKKLNDLPLADQLYNTMLVNKENKVILFGELFQNKQAEDLFFKAVNSCKN